MKGLPWKQLIVGLVAAWVYDKWVKPMVNR